MNPVGNCPQCGAPIYEKAVKSTRPIPPLNENPSETSDLRFTCPCYEWLQRAPEVATMPPTLWHRKAEVITQVIERAIGNKDWGTDSTPMKAQFLQSIIDLLNPDK